MNSKKTAVIAIVSAVTAAVATAKCEKIRNGINGGISWISQGVRNLFGGKSVTTTEEPTFVEEETVETPETK